jgi:hypothetical protein
MAELDEPAPAHVVNGDIVGRRLDRSALPGEVIVWRDVLHEGRIPPGPPALVQRKRAAFLAEAGFGGAEAIRADLAAADSALIAALDAGRETVLWFEHDLHDQLQLVQILARIAGHPGRESARLISLDRFPGHSRFAGMGELSVAELASLWPQRRTLDGRAFPTALRVYSALQQGDEAMLAEVAGASTPGLPYLPGALRRLLEEWPWTAPAAGRSERQILRAVAGGSRTAAEIFGATSAMEEAPYAGDAWVFRRIDELARGADALLVATPAGFELTPAGRAALDG